MTDLIDIATTILSTGVPLWLIGVLVAIFGYAVHRDILTKRQALRAVMAVVEAMDRGEGTTGDQVKREVERATNDGPQATIKDALQSFEEEGVIGGMHVRRLQGRDLADIRDLIDEEAQLLSKDRQNPSTLQRIGRTALRVAPTAIRLFIRR